MSNAVERRERAVDELMVRTRTIVDAGPLDRERLDKIRSGLQALAEQCELWSEDDYPSPDESVLQNRYLIAGEGDTGITLYLNVVRSGA